MDKEIMIMEEREISLWDLIVEILVHWRTLLVSMLVGGVLLGGFSYVRSSQNIKSQLSLLAGQEEKSSEESLVEKLSEEQLNNVTTALMYRKMYEEKLAYQQQVAMMQIDPFHVPRVELTFWVESDDMEKTYNIEKAYEDQLADMALCDYVKEQCKIEDDLSGLIFIEQPIYEHQKASNIVRVQIVYKDTDTCLAMAETVVKYVEQLRSKLEDVVGQHDIILLSESQSETVNSYFLSQQQNCVMDILTTQSNYIRLKNAFSDIELQYHDYILEAEASENSSANSALTSTNDKDIMDHNQEVQDGLEYIIRPSISGKYVLLGMILLTTMCVFWIFLRYILNNRVRATDSLQQLYHIPQLGVIMAFPKKRFFNVIDQQILKLRYHSQRRFSPEESENLATVSIKMAVKERKQKEVCLIGCNLAGHAQVFCEQTRERLKEENITVEILNNVLYDATAMEKLQHVQSVVLVETAGSTMYEEIVKELQLLGRQYIQVLGGVVVE